MRRLAIRPEGSYQAGRQRERSGLNGVLRPRAPWHPVESGVRSNAHGRPTYFSVDGASLFRGADKNDRLMSGIYPYNIYIMNKSASWCTYRTQSKSPVLSTHHLHAVLLLQRLTIETERERERESTCSRVIDYIIGPRLSRLPQ